MFVLIGDLITIASLYSPPCFTNKSLLEFQKEKYNYYYSFSFNPVLPTMCTVGFLIISSNPSLGKLYLGKINFYVNYKV